MSRRSTILVGALAVLALGLAAILGLEALGERLVDEAAIDARFPELGPPAGRPAADLEAAVDPREPEREALAPAEPEPAAKREASRADLGPLVAPATLSGRVVDGSGAGLAGATVVAHHRGRAEVGAQRAWSTSTDEEGAFRIEALAPAPYELDATAEGFVLAQRPRLELEPGASAALEIVLVRPAVVAGLVLDADSLPVEGASVGIVPPSTAPGMLALALDEAPHGKTDAAGRFELASGLHGSVLLGAVSDEAGASELLALELQPGARRDGLVLRLVGAGRIEGRVLRAGVPVPDLEVQAICFDAGGFREAATDAEGRFELAEAAPGRWLLMADLEDGRGIERPVLARADVRPGETTTVLLGSEEPGVRVLGRVTHRGAPVEGVELVFLSAAGPLADGVGLGRSDGDGRFEVELARGGSWSVRADPPRGWSACELQVEVPDAGEQLLDLALPTGRVAGSVVDADGPVAKAAVVLLPLGPASLLAGVGGPDRVTTDAAGRFAFEGVARGRWLLRASKGASEARGEELVLREGEQLDAPELVLGATGRVAVRARDAGGAPVALASVLVWHPSGLTTLPERHGSGTDLSGACEPFPLAPGRWWIAARTEALASVPVALDVRAGESAALELVLVPSTRVSVALRDARGALAAAGLTVLDAKGLDHAPLAGELEFFTRIVDETRRVGPLPPGSYRVLARAPDGRRAERTLRLEGEPERALELVLE